MEQEILERLRAKFENIPENVDAMSHAFYLEKTLKDIKAENIISADWSIDDYRKMYEAFQKNRVPLTQKPENVIGWLPWFSRQSRDAQHELLKHAGIFALQKGLLITVAGSVFALIQHFLGAPARNTQAIYQDWQVINVSYDRGGNGGRKQAIEDLYRHGESLNGLTLQNINGENKYAILSGLNLTPPSPWTILKSWFQGVFILGEPADLRNAIFHSAILDRAQLRGAVLNNANLPSCDLRGANLSDAHLVGANLKHTHLGGVNFSGADLTNAYLQESFFSYIDHTNGLLNDAKNSFKDLSITNLSGADLSGTDLSDAILLAIDLRQVKNLTQQQLEGAKAPLLCNVALPDGFNDKDKLKDRDCDRLPQVLAKHFTTGDNYKNRDQATQDVNEARQKQWK